MQGSPSYMSLPTSVPWRLLTSATAYSSPTTSATHDVNYPSTSAVSSPSNYLDYEKKVKNLTTTANTHLTEPGRILTQKDAVHAIATIANTQKPNFSLSSFIGGAPMHTKQCHPWPRSNSGVSTQNVGDFNQGPSQEHSESEIQKKLEVSGATNKPGRLRKSSSSMPLKRKIPILMRPNQDKNKGSDGQSSASLTSNPPFSSNETSILGTMASQKNGSTDPTSPGSKGEIPLATNLPPRPATSMALRNEDEPASPTLSTIIETSSVLTPRQNLEDIFVLSFDNGPPPATTSSENPRSRTRQAYPTKTQDDMSLDVYSAIDKYKSWSRQIIRRASLSATNSLMSFSESPTLSKTQTNLSSLRLDRGANGNRDGLEFPNGADPGNLESESKGVAPSISPVPKYLTEDSLSPSALTYTHMTLPPASDDIPLHHSQLPVRESVSTSASLSLSSDSRVSTPETTSMPLLYTTSSIGSRPKKNKAALAQLKADEEIIRAGLDGEFDGEACLMRYEPRQGWFGFWNKENVVGVIDGLRELRSPKP